MFTGIIEGLGTIAAIQKTSGNLEVTVHWEHAGELRVDQSVAHNGICLTVVAMQGTTYQVVAVDETIQKTSIGHWMVGQPINLERCLLVGGRLDGHFVQGHVDTTGCCTQVEDRNGSWLFSFSFPDAFAPLIIEKGSICVNGVSLTAFNVGANQFTVAIIPYTYHHTGFSTMQAGDVVNLEFDVLGKYLLRSQQLQATR